MARLFFYGFVLVLTSSAWAIVTISEDFAVDPGWAGLRNDDGIDNYGFKNSNELGLGAGVAGGEFDRGNAYSYYADQANFPRDFGASETISATVNFRSTNIMGPPVETANDDVFIGHISFTGSKDPDFMVGAQIRESSSTERRFRFIVGGTEVAPTNTPGDDYALIDVDENYTFSYDWQADGTFDWTLDGPVIGIMGSNNVARPTDFSLIDGWGFANRDRSGDTSGDGYNVFMDDVEYTSTIPEPTTWLMLISGVGFAVGILLRRRAKRQ